jgi:hypothetical protein
MELVRAADAALYTAKRKGDRMEAWRVALPGQEAFSAGTAFAFEPQASIKGQSVYPEGNFAFSAAGTDSFR